MKTLILLMPFIFSLLYVAVLITIIETVISPGKLKNAGCIKNTSESNFNQLITVFTVFEEEHQQTGALKSDAGFKTNINKINKVIDKLMKLQARSYEFISNNPTHKISTDFINQYVLSLFPDLVPVFDHQPKNSIDKDPYYGISYAGFSVIAVKAIQEQQMELLLKK